MSRDKFDIIGDDIFISKTAKVAKSACLNGPLIIDDNAEIRHCAYIRGNVIIGKNAVVDDLVTELTTSVEQLLNADKIPGQIADITVQKAEIEHKMSIYKEKGVAEKLKKQSGYALDNTKMDSVKNKICFVRRRKTSWRC